MSIKVTNPYHADCVLICKQFEDIAIATESLLVAITEQICCNPRHVPLTVALFTNEEDH
jgi:hypothetical protein